jgi:hypothetical protein
MISNIIVIVIVTTMSIRMRSEAEWCEIGKRLKFQTERYLPADTAALGHTWESRFAGPLCSAHRSCCPPRTSLASSGVRFASGSKL